jgi:IS30 family transposase
MNHARAPTGAGWLQAGRFMVVSAVATLAGRASRFCLIIPLPDDRTADKVADALADRTLTLPGALRRTLTLPGAVRRTLT